MIVQGGSGELSVVLGGSFRGCDGNYGDAELLILAR